MNLKNTMMNKEDSRIWFLKGVRCVKEYGSLVSDEMVDLFNFEWEKVNNDMIVDNKEDLFRQIDNNNLNEEDIKELSSIINNFKDKQ